MTLCPVALTAGCKKCPIFSICLVKGLVGDHKPTEKTKTEKEESRKE